MAFARLALIVAMLAFCLWPGQVPANGRTELDVPYVGGGTARGSDLTTLDVFFGSDRTGPLIVYVHGGGWRRGDKRGARLPGLQFAASGYAFASVNYRLRPEADIGGMASDVGDAVRFLVGRASRYGFDPNRIVLMGHSAGAHLAALVAADPRYLGDDRKRVSGLVLLDGVAYDVEEALRSQSRLEEVFGSTPELWRSVSPVTYIRAASGMPATFIAYGFQRRDTAQQAKALASALTGRGAVVQLRPDRDKDHAAFIRDLAKRDDPLTKDVLAFIGRL